MEGIRYSSTNEIEIPQILVYTSQHSLQVFHIFKAVWFLTSVWKISCLYNNDTDNGGDDIDGDEDNHEFVEYGHRHAGTAFLIDHSKV